MLYIKNTTNQDLIIKCILNEKENIIRFPENETIEITEKMDSDLRANCNQYLRLQKEGKLSVCSFIFSENDDNYYKTFKPIKAEKLSNGIKLYFESEFLAGEYATIRYTYDGGVFHEQEGQFDENGKLSFTLEGVTKFAEFRLYNGSIYTGDWIFAFTPRIKVSVVR